MSLAGKFGNFEIKKSDRISQEDQAWLTHREELYKRAIAVYKSIYDIYKAENETYSKDDLENYRYSSLLIGDFDIPKKLSNVQNTYISGIFSYFSSKYDVQLTNNFEEYDLNRELYRYRNTDPIKDIVIDFIDYHTVLEKIFDQLGGMSFEEKAIKEVKDKLKSKCYNSYHDIWRIKIKGNKFIYTDGYCSKEIYFDYYNFGSTEWLRAFLDALSCNTYGKKTHIQSLNKLYDSYHVRLENDDFQDGFSAPEVGVDHIKFYKNGRVDVTFKSGEFCRDFAREWCGYTLV